MPSRVQILKTEMMTHNVRRYHVEKPKNFVFAPGQATEVSLDKPGWEAEKRPFTFTSLPQESTLEFTIKSYRDHPGVTNALWGSEAGDHLLLGDAWGTIQYQGRGTFIAGGAGVTPFIAILRSLHAKGGLKGNQLIASNQTARDIILRDEFESMADLEHSGRSPMTQNRACCRSGSTRPSSKSTSATSSRTSISADPMRWSPIFGRR